MKGNLLSKVRRLNNVLSESTSGFVSFDELCNILYDMLNANVYILNKRGKVLAAKFDDGEEAPLVKVEGGHFELPKEFNDKFLERKEACENLTNDAIKNIYGEEYSLSSKYHTIVPVIFGGKRVATLLYVATVVGIEVTRGIALEEEEDNRLKAAVSVALETLSYSELEAVIKIFEELNGNEGLLVASKIADMSGITRSVIVNALRKLESAGVIESRSLGMKGTRIKITNEFLREEIEKVEI